MYIYFFAEVSLIIYKTAVFCVIGSQFVAMVLEDRCEVVLDLDGSLRCTRVPTCWSLLDNICVVNAVRSRSVPHVALL